MSELNTESQTPASQVERLVRYESDWNDSSIEEPAASPLYLCRDAIGQELICSRLMSDEGPKWERGGYFRHGITHWKRIID